MGTPWASVASSQGFPSHLGEQEARSIPQGCFFFRRRRAQSRGYLRNTSPLQRAISYRHTCGAKLGVPGPRPIAPTGLPYCFACCSAYCSPTVAPLLRQLGPIWRRNMLKPPNLAFFCGRAQGKLSRKEKRQCDAVREWPRHGHSGD